MELQVGDRDRLVEALDLYEIPIEYSSHLIQSVEQMSQTMDGSITSSALVPLAVELQLARLVEQHKHDFDRVAACWMQPMFESSPLLDPQPYTAALCRIHYQGIKRELTKRPSEQELSVLQLDSSLEARMRRIYMSIAARLPGVDLDDTFEDEGEALHVFGFDHGAGNSFNPVSSSDQSPFQARFDRVQQRVHPYHTAPDHVFEVKEDGEDRNTAEDDRKRCIWTQWCQRDEQNEIEVDNQGREPCGESSSSEEGDDSFWRKQRTRLKSKQDKSSRQTSVNQVQEDRMSSVDQVEEGLSLCKNPGTILFDREQCFQPPFLPLPMLIYNLLSSSTHMLVDHFFPRCNPSLLVQPSWSYLQLYYTREESSDPSALVQALKTIGQQNEVVGMFRSILSIDSAQPAHIVVHPPSPSNPDPSIAPVWFFLIHHNERSQLDTCSFVQRVESVDGAIVQVPLASSSLSFAPLPYHPILAFAGLPSFQWFGSMASNDEVMVVTTSAADQCWTDFLASMVQWTFEQCNIRLVGARLIYNQPKETPFLVLAWSGPQCIEEVQTKIEGISITVQCSTSPAQGRRDLYKYFGRRLLPQSIRQKALFRPFYTVVDQSIGS